MSLLSPQLEAFIAITKNKTVHGAAGDLHVTQTAVTQRIRALEAKLRTSLFIRTRRGMLLTPEGEALLRYCHAAQDLEGEALAYISKAGIQSTIRINITGPSSIMRSRIIPSCMPVLKKFKHLLLTFKINDIEIREKDLKAGDVQFAILQPEQLAAEMEHKKLAPEKYVLICTKKWRNRHLKDIIANERIIDFDPSDQMTFAYLKQYHLSHAINLERFFVNNTEALAKMIIEGHGYGVLTTEFCEPYLENKQLILLNAGKRYENKQVLAWYPRPEYPAYMQALIDAIN